MMHTKTSGFGLDLGSSNLEGTCHLINNYTITTIIEAVLFNYYLQDYSMNFRRYLHVEIMF